MNMEILEGKFKKEEDDDKSYHYRCGSCGAKFKEKISLCSKCLERNTIEKIIEKIVKEKGEAEIEAVKGIESFEEFSKGLGGGYHEGYHEVEELKTPLKKEAIVIKVKEKRVTSPHLKKEEEKLRLKFEIDPQIKKEINAAKLEINDFARYMGKNLDSGNEKNFRRLKNKLENSIKERIERIKENPVAQREPEAVEWLINEMFKDENLSKFFHENELVESFKKIKDSLRSSL